MSFAMSKFEGAKIIAHERITTISKFLTTNKVEHIQHEVSIHIPLGNAIIQETKKMEPVFLSIDVWAPIMEGQKYYCDTLPFYYIDKKREFIYGPCGNYENRCELDQIILEITRIKKEMAITMFRFDYVRPQVEEFTLQDRQKLDRLKVKQVNWEFHLSRKRVHEIIVVNNPKPALYEK